MNETVSCWHCVCCVHRYTFVISGIFALLPSMSTSNIRLEYYRTILCVAKYSVSRVIPTALCPMPTSKPRILHHRVRVYIYLPDVSASPGRPRPRPRCPCLLCVSTRRPWRRSGAPAGSGTTAGTTAAARPPRWSARRTPARPPKNDSIDWIMQWSSL